MSQLDGAKAIVIVTIKDGKPTVVINGNSRNYAADKMLAAELVKASMGSKVFPKTTSVHGK